MTHKLNLLILTLFLSGCSLDKEIVNCKALINENNIFSVNGNIYNGICNAYSEDGLVLESKHYKNGIINKVEGFHYPGGEIKFIGFYKNNLPHGSYKQFWLNGEMERKGRIKQGFYVGKWKLYDKDGKNYKTIWFNDQGQIENEIIN
jgi:antitoxin component YwqK of YwqJK toxin-antitoxin module